MNRVVSTLVSATIPGIVGGVMIVATWGIIHSVRQEIGSLATDAAKTAVQETLGMTKPAIEWKGVIVSTPVVKIGGELIVSYTARVNKQCPADLRSFLIDRTGAAAYRFPDTQGGYSTANRNSDQTITVRRVIRDPLAGENLAPLQPGVYTYRVTAIRYCETTQLDSFIPDATFTLER